MDTIPIHTLVFDADIWPRVQRNDGRVDQLADILNAGISLQPVRVERETNRVLGGWHTVAAYQRHGRTDVPVEWVAIDTDVPGAALLYAYKLDENTALPYTEADVRSVAQRLYRMYAAEFAIGNGDSAPNVSALAKSLGRPRKTVEGWLRDDIDATQRRLVRDRAVRQVVVQALRAADLKFEAIENIIHKSHGQIVSDGEVAITDYLADAAIVLHAQGRLTEIRLAGLLTAEQAQAAHDWIVGQTQPEYLTAQLRSRLLTPVLETTQAARRTLEQIDRAGLAAHIGVHDPMVTEREAAIRLEIQAIEQIIHDIRKGLNDEEA